MTDLKMALSTALQSKLAAMLGKLVGVSEYDLRRPMTPTGTNLLGLVKHLAGVEHGYFGECFDRPPVERPSWFRDDPNTEIDMWAMPDESTDYITGVYQKACAHADITIAELDLDSPGHVAHWDEGHRETTLGHLLIGMIGETAQHAGHADIVRELIDGQIGADNTLIADESDSVARAKDGDPNGRRFLPAALNSQRYRQSVVPAQPSYRRDGFGWSAWFTYVWPVGAVHSVAPSGFRCTLQPWSCFSS